MIRMLRLLIIIVVISNFANPLWSQNTAEEKVKSGLEYYNKLSSYSNWDSMFICGKKAYELLKDSKYKEEAASSLLYMAIAKDYSGQKKACKKYLDLALEYTEQNIGTDNDYYNTGLNILGAYYQDFGDYSNAQAMYEQAIRSHKQSKNQNPSTLSSFYTNLGFLHYSFGEMANSISSLENAMRLILEAEDSSPQDVAAIEVNLANAYLQEGDTVLAKKHYRECLGRIKNSRERYDIQNKIYAYQGLAEIYISQNQAGSARWCLDQLSQIRAQYGSQFQQDYKSHSIAGKLYAQLGQVGVSDTLYDRAVEGAEDWFKDFSKNAEVAAMLSEKARMYHQNGLLDKALQTYQQALVENSSGFESLEWSQNPGHQQLLNPSYGLQIWTGKARTLYDQFLKSKKVTYLDEALEVCESTTQLIFYIRNTYEAAQARLFLSGQVVPFYELAITIALEKYEQSRQAKYKSLAFRYAESNKAILLLESLSKNKALMASDLNSNLVERENELNKEIAYYQKKIAEQKQKKPGPDQSEQELSDQIEKWESLLFELKEDRKLVLDSLSEQYPRIYNQDISSSIITARALSRDLLSSRDALLEVFIGEQKLFVFLLHQGGTEVLSSKNIASLKEEVQNINSVLHRPPQSSGFQEDFEVFVQSAHSIYQELLSPLLAKLPSKVNNLIIVPDGFLSQIPFEVLQTENSLPLRASYRPSQLAYLMEKYKVNYQYSANLLAQAGAHDIRQSPLKILASAPVFQTEKYVDERSCAMDELSNLQCNREEVEQIQSILSEKASFTLDNHSASFLSKMLDYDILHLATHACLDRENPKNTRIFFSDDYLTAYDLAGIRFEPELIVLSACNTGTGKLLEGEGVYSLAREFTIAGSRSTLTSFWAIDDCSTSRIMSAYYESLREGNKKSEALRQAKIRFLETADPETSHPYYWAAFLQFGDDRPLYQPRNYGIYVLLVALLIVAGIFTYKRWFKA